MIICGLFHNNMCNLENIYIAKEQIDTFVIVISYHQNIHTFRLFDVVSYYTYYSCTLVYTYTMTI